jgi:hypothetical protein
LRAAADCPAEPLVFVALRAEADLEDALRRFAAVLACFDSAFLETVDRGSRLSARSAARARFVEVFLVDFLPAV